MQLIHVAYLLTAVQLTVGHKDNAYQHQDYLPPNENWMSLIPRTTRLNRMSIPGTHDSGALHGGLSIQCQSVSFKNQVRAGIRAFDIRLKLEKDKLQVYHGSSNQKYTFGEILRDFKIFLEYHSQETLILRIKDESKKAHDIPDLDFSNRYEKEIADYVHSDGYQNFIWRGTHNDPKLEDVRRQMVIFDDFSRSSEWSQPAMTDYGINYKYFYDSTQDDFNIIGHKNTYSKWEKVKKQLQDAVAHSKEQFYINFLSASGGLSIHTYASGHTAAANGADRLYIGASAFPSEYKDWIRKSCLGNLCSIYMEGNNILTRDYIRDRQLKGVGIIFADFPGRDLIQKIIDSNIY